MKRRRNKLVRRISMVLTVLFFSMNMYTIAAHAAAPILVVKTAADALSETASSADAPSEASTLSKSNKTRVTNLRIINLEAPRSGKEFDKRATVMTDQGIFWEIPVVWIDEAGSAALICLPGKRYTPVFTFYTPATVEIGTDPAIGGYTIKLPEFLDGLMSSEDLVMIEDPSKNITYIASSALITSAVDGAAENGLTSSIANVSTLTNFFANNSNKLAYNYAAYTVAKGTETPSGSSGTSSESSGDSAGSSDAPAPSPAPAVDLVKIHCTDNAINAYGYDALSKVVDLVRNVIEPQAVYQLYSNFPAYTQALSEKALGQSIGLYVYSGKSGESSVDALAFIKPSGGEKYTDYSYFLGVNVSEVLKQDTSTGEYVINEKDRTDLENSIIHEMAHAFMDDYTRSGSSGYGKDEDTALQNYFPIWFKEGIASSVENFYEYRYYAFDDMKVDSQGNTKEKTDADTFLYYYQNNTGNPSIDSQHEYYYNTDNEYSAYVSGYLASLYLSSLATNYLIDKYPEETHETVMQINDKGEAVYNNKAFIEGYNYILKQLHEGTSLNTIINTISNGSYEDTVDFQDKFVTGTGESEAGKSLDFCVSFVNYMQDVSKELQTKTSDPYRRANGSILLPFDTEKHSIIETTVPEEMGTQMLYVIADSKDYVKSTVDADIAIASAGVVDVGGPVSAFYNGNTIQVAAKLNAADEEQGKETADIAVDDAGCKEAAEEDKTVDEAKDAVGADSTAVYEESNETSEENKSADEAKAAAGSEMINAGSADDKHEAADSEETATQAADSEEDATQAAGSQEAATQAADSEEAATQAAGSQEAASQTADSLETASKGEAGDTQKKNASDDSTKTDEESNASDSTTTVAEEKQEKNLEDAPVPAKTQESVPVILPDPNQLPAPAPESDDTPEGGNSGDGDSAGDGSTGEATKAEESTSQESSAQEEAPQI